MMDLCTPPINPAAAACDVNGDCLVNVADLLDTLTEFGAVDTPDPSCAGAGR
jgi:hypothetical protein